LIVSAIKFSPPGSQLTVSAAAIERCIRVSVKYQGIGIPSEIALNLFKFTTVGNTKGTKGEESFDLGLYICKKILDDHQGQIWFNSKEGAETAFYITLPSCNTL
jgi:signal transduction histidine kinase